jgi:purine-cytosine permease-like protein
LIIWIVILLLFVASIVAAYFGARYWHWAHVTLVVLIFLSAVGFFVLASETLRINAVLRKQVNALDTQLAQVQSNV